MSTSRAVVADIARKLWGDADVNLGQGKLSTPTGSSYRELNSHLHTQTQGLLTQEGATVEEIAEFNSTYWNQYDSKVLKDNPTGSALQTQLRAANEPGYDATRKLGWVDGIIAGFRIEHARVDELIRQNRMLADDLTHVREQRDIYEETVDRMGADLEQIRAVAADRIENPRVMHVEHHAGTIDTALLSMLKGESGAAAPLSLGLLLAMFATPFFLRR